MSGRAIPAKERLILALDVPDPGQARDLVDRLGDTVSFYKVGLELFMAGGALDLVDELVARGHRVLVDLKFFDVPRTVGAACERLAGRGVTYATVHGNEAMLRAAAGAAGDVGVLAVTVLTSLDEDDLTDLGFQVSVADLVLSRARRALQAGCAGVISSGLEVARLRRAHGDAAVVVVPGIRPVTNDRVDDQKRTTDVEGALAAGADHIVVGRPIRQAADPVAAARAVQSRIADFLAGAD